MKLSVVSTLYNSSPYIDEFLDRCASAAEKAGFPSFEIILVNDGSPDSSLMVAKASLPSRPYLRIIDLSRNFGHHRAMMTGLMKASGERVFMIDSDLEEPPEDLERMAERMKERPDADVVYGVQAARKGGVFERVTGELYYKALNLLSEHEIPRNVVTSRLMTRRYVQALTSYRETEAFLGGLWVAAGFTQVPIVVQKASTSPTTYTFSRKMSIVLNSVTTTSRKPLIGIFFIGLICTGLASVGILIVVIQALFFKTLNGWASVVVSIWFFGGVTVSCIGVIGIYLSRIFMETKRRPYVTIREELTAEGHATTHAGSG